MPSAGNTSVITTTPKPTNSSVSRSGNGFPSTTIGIDSTAAAETAPRIPPPASSASSRAGSSARGLHERERSASRNPAMYGTLSTQATRTPRSPRPRRAWSRSACPGSSLSSVSSTPANWSPISRNSIDSAKNWIGSQNASARMRVAGAISRGERTAHDQARDDRGEDPGHVQPVGREEGPVRGQHRDGDLDLGLVEAPPHLRGDPPDHRAHGDASEHDRPRTPASPNPARSWLPPPPRAPPAAR